ncbi:hypothetical protein ASF59_20090 [Methylobacterium sp. Leaf121]|nr:hypothetical protein ASF59_20090 [Methylobacterium sp. Leaf121]
MMDVFSACPLLTAVLCRLRCNAKELTMQWFKREQRDQRDVAFWLRFVGYGVICCLLIFGGLYFAGLAWEAIAKAAR